MASEETPHLFPSCEFLLQNIRTSEAPDTVMGSEYLKAVGTLAQYLSVSQKENLYQRLSQNPFSLLNTGEKPEILGSHEYVFEMEFLSKIRECLETSGQVQRYVPLLSSEIRSAGQELFKVKNESQELLRNLSPLQFAVAEFLLWSSLQRIGIDISANWLVKTTDVYRNSFEILSLFPSISGEWKKVSFNGYQILHFLIEGDRLHILLKKTLLGSNKDSPGKFYYQQIDLRTWNTLISKWFSLPDAPNSEVGLALIPGEAYPVVFENNRFYNESTISKHKAFGFYRLENLGSDELKAIPIIFEFFVPSSSPSRKGVSGTYSYDRVNRPLFEYELLLANALLRVGPHYYPLPLAAQSGRLPLVHQSLVKLPRDLAHNAKKEWMSTPDFRVSYSSNLTTKIISISLYVSGQNKPQATVDIPILFQSKSRHLDSVEIFKSGDGVLFGIFEYVERKTRQSIPTGRHWLIINFKEQKIRELPWKDERLKGECAVNFHTQAGIPWVIAVRKKSGGVLSAALYEVGALWDLALPVKDPASSPK